MGFFDLLKRKYQWRGEHYLHALTEQDMSKRRAILSEFMKCLYNNGVPRSLIDGQDQQFEQYIIRGATKKPVRTIYELAEELAEELKAPI